MSTLEQYRQKKLAEWMSWLKRNGFDLSTADGGLIRARCSHCTPYFDSKPQVRHEPNCPNEVK